MKRTGLSFLPLVFFLTGIIILIFNPLAYSQDTIFLLNGDVITGKVSSDIGEFFSFEWQKPGKVRTVAIEKTEIFSIHYEGGLQKMVYQPDSALGRDFTYGQMSDFMEGERNAGKFYKPGLPVYGAAVVGVAGAYMGFWGFLLPTLYLGGLSLRKPPCDTGLPVPNTVRDKEFYEMGYRHTARKKKLQHSAVAALGGLVTIWIVKVATGGLK
ncbi:MAG: hypothetical protein NTU44_17825 [Bacteroidetes bacterium]|nr:hypothetical protein [Bacteroidota bacterium]